MKTHKKIISKQRLPGLIIAVCILIAVIIFAKAMTNFAMERYDEANRAEREALEKINSRAEEIAQQAAKERDSIAGINLMTQQRVTEMKIQLEKQNNVLNKFQNSYDKSINELNQIKNEKVYIPNATVAEQLDFLSKYKYEPFK